MICQRCGNCCSFCVGIITKDKRLLWKPDGVLCPHLSWDGSKAVCAVHELPAYKGSACDIYGNPEYDVDYMGTENRPCRVGTEIQKKGGLKVTHPHLFENRVELDDLEDLKEY